MKMFLEVCGLIFAALAGGFAALKGASRQYRFGPFLEGPPEAPKQPQDTSSSLIQPTVPESAHEAVKPVNRLIDFCSAIRDFEGGPGALNYQLNNPGDCRPSPVGYLSKYQPVEIIDTNTDPRYLFHKGKFAKFPTYELGWEYLQNMVHYTAHVHPTWTILDFFNHYAPSIDQNDPNGYAANVAKRCAVSTTTTLAALFV